MTHSSTGDFELSQREQDLDSALERFEAAWRGARPPEIEDFLAPAGSPQAIALRREFLEELLKIDLEYRWRRPPRSGAGLSVASIAGSVPAAMPPAAASILPDRPCLEDYLARYPEIGPVEQVSVDLIAEEYRVRRRWGDRPEQALYLARFPRQGAALSMALDRIDRDQSCQPTTDTSSAPDTDVVLAAPSIAGPAGPEDEMENATAGNLMAMTMAGRGVSAKVQPPRGDLPEKIGRYAVRDLLGRGGFGTVYLGFDEALSRPVAIKVPRPDRFRTRQDIQAFFREARLAAQLRHPALVDVYDVGQEPGCDCYIVMQFIDGHPLSVLLKRDRVPAEAATRWIAQVAEALHCAHKIGLVHGDLKPANILIDREGQPHVADFGLVIAEAEQRDQPGQVTGTPAYMAPEQVRGESHRLDGRTDLWALGVVFYELLTGRRPFAGATVHELFDEILNREPKPPRQIDDSIPAELEWICLKLLSKRVADRYTTGMDLVTDLRSTLDSVSIDPGGSLASRRIGGRSGERPWESVQRSIVGRQSASQSSRSTRPTNLPVPATSFIGREKNVQDLVVLLADETLPLVTLIGPGGIGKTRLAIRLGDLLLQGLPGGCWFADLTEARTAAEIALGVARALSVPLTSHEPPEEMVANVLEYRKPLLLILDNFEQAVEHAETTVGRWRHRAPQIQFLVTSRSPLALAGEREYILEPLAAPPAPAAGETVSSSAEEIAAFESVRLFRDRAAEAHPGFALDDSNAQAVAAICADLEGIPLAVELAAARVKILKPAQIASKLGQKFQILQSSRRDLTPRQQTMLGAIDWSYDLLNGWEKQAFLQASLFRGGFNLEAAENVLDLTDFPDAPMVLDVVQGLRDKSLITLVETRHETRYGMYVSIRDYGEQKWRITADAARQQALWRRFAAHFVAWGESWNSRLHTAAGAEALDRLHVETENLFAVQDWALAAGEPVLAARAILALARTMAIRGPVDQRAPRLERSLAALSTAVGQVAFDAGAAELLVRLLTAASEAAQRGGAMDRAAELADLAVDAARASGPGPALIVALRQQGEIRRQRGDIDGALAAYSESEALARAAGDEHGLALALAARGFVVWQRGDSELALRLYAQAEEILHDLGDHISMASIGRNRGHVLGQRGDYNGALRCYAEAEGIGRDLGDDRSIALAVGNRGIVLADLGDYAGALECYQKAESLARKLGDKRGIAINVGNRGILLADRGDPGAALACCREAEALNRELRTKFGIAVNLGGQANALADLGRHDEALGRFAEAEALCRQMGNKFLLALNVGDRAGLYLARGNMAEARNALEESLSLLEQVGASKSVEAFSYQTLLAQAHCALGQPDTARALAEKALALADQLRLSDQHPKLKIRAHLAALRAMGD
jgi:serine/threonine protein kinase/predicted ATPase